MSEPVSRPNIPAEAAPGEWTAPSRLWLTTLAAGVLATVLTWAAGEAAVDFFRGKAAQDPLKEVVDTAGIVRVAVNNAALGHGLQGALLGLTLGLAAGAAARRPARAVATAGLTGLVLGGVLGSAASFGLSTLYFATTDANTQSLLPSLLMHVGIASLLGASGGAAFGLGLGGWRRVAKAAGGGLIGAASAQAFMTSSVPCYSPSTRRAILSPRPAWPASSGIP